VEGTTAGVVIGPGGVCVAGGGGVCVAVECMRRWWSAGVA